MNKKLAALALAGTLTLTLLSACGAPPAETTPPAATPTPPVTTVVPTPAPSETPPAIDDLPVETLEPDAGPDNLPADPNASVNPGDLEKPGETSKPEPSPEASKKPAPLPEPVPSETPAPSETPDAETSAVQSVWNEVADLERPSLMDLDDSLLTDLYGIDPADLEEYIGKMPLMSAHVTEFLIAKAAPGKADAIKQACQDRQTALSSNNQYPSNTALVDGYQIVVNGDYVLFVIDEYADQMVEAFNTYTK